MLIEIKSYISLHGIISTNNVMCVKGMYNRIICNHEHSQAISSFSKSIFSENINIYICTYLTTVSENSKFTSLTP